MTASEDLADEVTALIAERLGVDTNDVHQAALDIVTSALEQATSQGYIEDKPVLGWYRGEAIRRATGKFTNLGDGLSKAMDIEGGIDKPGSIVTFVVSCRVGRHSLELLTGDDEDELGEGYELTHTYRGGTVARIDPDLVRSVLLTMETRIADKEGGAGTLIGAEEGRTETPGEGVKVGDGEPGEGDQELPPHLAALAGEDDFHDSEQDPDAPNPLVGANVGGADADSA